MVLPGFYHVLVVSPHGFLLFQTVKNVGLDEQNQVLFPSCKLKIMNFEMTS